MGNNLSKEYKPLTRQQSLCKDEENLKVELQN